MPHHTAPIKDAIIPHVQLCGVFTRSLTDLYRTEKDLLMWLASIHSQVSYTELKELFGDYTYQLEKQLIRLEEIFGLMLEKPGKGDAEAIRSMISAMKRIVDQSSQRSNIRDIALVLEVQKVINYKVAFYKNLELISTSLGMEEAANLLHLSSEEENDMGLLFADLVERRMNHLVETERY